MDYGLWLLIGLLVVIALVFLLSGRSKGSAPAGPVAQADAIVPAPASAPASAAIEPLAEDAAPLYVEPVSVDPLPVGPDPIPATPEPLPVTPDPIPVSPVAAAAPEEADDLLRLKGVGPKLKALLIGLGVTRYAQIAAWSDSDIATLDARLGNFKGRPVRDQWVDQAKYLAAGDIAGFEAKYGKV